MPPPAARINVTTAVAVRAESGLFFGTLRWIEAERLLVEIDAEFEQGDELDVRITLAPTTSTALLNAVVARPLVTAKGESNRYILDIIRVTATEKVLLDDWKGNVGNRGTFSTFNTVVTSQRFGESSSAQSNAEVRQALARMARRPPPSGSKAYSDAFELPSDIVTGGTSGSSRGAMRDALKGAIARGAAGRAVASARPPDASSVAPTRPVPPVGYTPSVAPVAPTPSVAPVVPSSPVPSPPVPPKMATAPVVPAAPPPAAALTPKTPSSDPSYASTQTRHACWVEVRWHDPDTFAQACRSHLFDGMLVLKRGNDELPSLMPMRVMLRHAELLVECAASVVAHTAHAASYRLQLDALQLERLHLWVDDYGKK